LGGYIFVCCGERDSIDKLLVSLYTRDFMCILQGNATMHLYPHLQPLQEVGGMFRHFVQYCMLCFPYTVYELLLQKHFSSSSGVMDYIATEVTTSKQKKFSLVMFIDTPGLVDGDMKYPFDVNKAILWLGQHIADRIFVFFDPIG